MICGHGHIEGHPVAVIVNQRGIIKGRPGGEERPRFGGIIYTDSADKVAYFIETASRERLPLLFILYRRSSSRSITHRGPATTPWRGRDSTRISFSRGQPGGWV
jgi:hypothetical protein